MSESVDDRIVRLEFQNQGFREGITESINSLRSLGDALKLGAHTSGLDQIAKTANGISFDNLLTGINELNNRFTLCGTIVQKVYDKIANFVTGTASKMFNMVAVQPITDGFKEYETKMNSIQVIQANTMGKNSMEEIEGSLDDLNQYADKTIYNFGQMTSNVGKFVAQGLDVKEAANAVKGMANLAAASGASPEDMARATYQMSQALSGTVKLMDWNSLRNANMATTEFKNTLIALAKTHGIAIDEMIKDEGSFEQTLSKGWLSGSMLTDAMNIYSGTYANGLDEAELKAQGFSDDQIKHFKELAAMAEKAATKIRTFTQLKDTIAEDVGSSWGKSYELIFGGFEESSNLFTAIHDAIGPAISAVGDFRNEMLQTWVDTGGREALIRGIGNAFKFLSEMVNAVHTAWVNTVGSLSGAVFTQISKGIETFTGMLHTSSATMNNFQNALAVLTIPFRALKETITAVAGTVIPPLMSTLGMLANLFLFLAGTVGRAVQVVYVFLKSALAPIVEKLGEGSSKFTEFIKALNGSMNGSLDQATNKIKNFFDELQAKATKAGEVTKKVLTVLQPIFTAIGQVAKNAFEGIKNIFGAFKDIKLPENSKSILDFIKQFIDNIKNVLSGANLSDGPNIFEAIGNAIKAIAGGLDTVSLGDIAKNGILAVAAIKVITSIAKAFSLFHAVRNSPFSAVTEVMVSFGGTMHKLNGVLGAMKTNIQVDTIKDAVTAIAILAGTLVVLAMVPADDLNRAVGILLGVIGVLVVLKLVYDYAETHMKSIATSAEDTEEAADGAAESTSMWDGIAKELTATLTNIGNQFAKAIKYVSIGIMALMIAAAIVILVMAFKMMQKAINDGHVAEALIALTVLAGILLGAIAVVAVINKYLSLSLSSMAGVVLVAIGILTMVNALAKIAKIPTEEFDKASMNMLKLVGIIALLTLVSKLAGKGFASMGIGFILLTSAITMLLIPIEVLGRSSADIDRALVALGKIAAGMAILVLVMAIAARISGTGGSIKFVSIGASMVMMAGSILVLAGAFKLLSTIPVESLSKVSEVILKLIVALGAFMVVMGVVSMIPGLAINLLSMSVTLLAISASVLVFAAAIALLTLVGDNFDVALKTIAIVLVEFAAAVAVFGILGMIFGPGIIAITLLVAALAVLAVAIGVTLAAITGFLAFITSKGEEIVDGIINIAKKIEARRDDFVNAIATIIDAVVSGIVIGLTKALLTMMSMLDIMAQALWLWLTGKEVNIEELMADGGTKIGNKGRSVIGLIAGDILKALLSLVEGVISLVLGGIQIVGGLLSEYLGIDWVKDVADKAEASVHEHFGNVKQAITEEIQGIPEETAPVTEETKERMGKASGDIASTYLANYDIADKVVEEHKAAQSAAEAGTAQTAETLAAGAQAETAAFSDNLDLETPGMANIEAFKQQFQHGSVDATSMMETLGLDLTKSADISEGLGTVGANNMGTFYSEMLSNGTMNGAQLEEQLRSQGASVPEGFQQGLAEKQAEGPEATAAWIQSIIDSAATGLDSHSPSRVFQNFGEGTVSGFVGGVNTKAQEAITAVGGMIQKVISAVTSKQVDFKNTAGAFMNNFKTGMSEKVEGIMTTVRNMLTKISGGIAEKYPAIYSQGSTLVGKFKEGLNSAVESVRSIGASIGNAVLGGISSVKSAFVGLGQDMMAGLQNGINSMAASVGAAAAAASSNALNQAKSAVKSSSPSKDFMKLGQDDDKGLIIGLLSMKDEVGKAGSEVSLEALASVENTANDIITYLNNHPDFEPSISPVLDLTNLNAGMGLIGNMFHGYNAQLGNISGQLDLRSESQQYIMDLLRQQQSMLTDLSNKISRERLDPNTIYEAVRVGASNASIHMVADNREVTRYMKNLGVSFG